MDYNTGTISSISDSYRELFEQALHLRVSAQKMKSIFKRDLLVVVFTMITANYMRYQVSTSNQLTQGAAGCC